MSAGAVLRAPRVAAAVAVAAGLVVAAPTPATPQDVSRVVLGGRVGVALVTLPDGRVALLAAESAVRGLVRVVLRACDTDGCAAESGLREGEVSLAGGSWRLDVDTATIGRVRLTSAARAGTLSSRGCSVRLRGLAATVAAEGADLASATWGGTIDGAAVSAVPGPRCAVVHTVGETVVSYGDA